uniref:YqaJ viral recombinase domain-containing protein n=1 Tax=Rhizophora mucronata TaxID=61149 RepID=A0A2P2J0Z5_RHIMU
MQRIGKVTSILSKGLVYSFLSSFGLLYHNHSYSCKIRALIMAPIRSNRRNYSSQVLLDPTNERFSHDIPRYNHPYETSDNLLHSPNSTGETYSVLQSSALQHWFKNWQEKRRHKLTASTFGAAIGFWPHRRVQLWLEKIGAREPFSGNLATCWSNIKEEEALERYKLITGNNILFPEFQVYGEDNTENSWLAASPDGLVDRLVYELPSRGVLEIKCPFFDGDMSKATPWKRVPLHYIPQAQGLMEILDRDWMDFYVWTPKGSSLFRLFRDVEYWDSLRIVLSDFWWKHVLPARDMCSRCVITDPLNQLQVLKPAPRHELCYCMIVKSKMVVDGSKLLVREIDGQLQD